MKQEFDEATDHSCFENQEIVSSGGSDTNPLPVCKVCGKIVYKKSDKPLCLKE
jgi:hypothetical protein